MGLGYIETLYPGAEINRVTRKWSTAAQNIVLIQRQL